jgi:hypothetical protein
MSHARCMLYRQGYTRARSAYTHTANYVMLIAFPLQQWLHERPWVLRYTYIDCLLRVPYRGLRQSVKTTGLCLSRWHKTRLHVITMFFFNWNISVTGHRHQTVWLPLWENFQGHRRTSESPTIGYRWKFDNLEGKVFDVVVGKHVTLIQSGVRQSFAVRNSSYSQQAQFVALLT